MPARIVVSAGERFGRWTVVGEPLPPEGSNRGWRYLCRCDCGAEKHIRIGDLRNGNTTSCGCKRIDSKTTNGLFSKDTRGKTPWSNYRRMVERCHDTESPSYPRYGGRGISVCREWRQSFEEFARWSFANGFEPGLQIDRIDGTKGYSPDNCRWVTSKENQRNKPNNVLVTAFGETKTVSAWAEDPRCGVPHQTIRGRIYRGWNPADAVLTPSGKPKPASPVA